MKNIIHKFAKMCDSFLIPTLEKIDKEDEHIRLMGERILDAARGGMMYCYFTCGSNFFRERRKWLSDNGFEYDWYREGNYYTFHIKW